MWLVVQHLWEFLAALPSHGGQYGDLTMASQPVSGTSILKGNTGQNTGLHAIGSLNRYAVGSPQQANTGVGQCGPQASRQTHHACWRSLWQM